MVEKMLTNTKQYVVITKNEINNMLNTVKLRLNYLMKDEPHNPMDYIIIRPFHKSLTMNKKIIYLCLIDKHTQNMADINNIMYVAIHELSHVICKDVGHTPEFMKIFTYLLNKSKTLNIINPKSLFKNYC